MNIVITGGLGHIGSKLIRTLPLDYNITVIDNLLTQRYYSLFNIDRKIKFIECDFTEYEYPKDSIVIHLAAITNASSKDNKDMIESINIDKTKKLIDKCTDSLVKLFIFPSSTSVYGVATDVVTEDNKEYENPQSPYAESKLEIENYLKGNPNINYYILRFGTIFGKSCGMRFHTAVNKFCYELSKEQPLTIWEENFHQYRPYLGLIDCVESIKHVINLPKENQNNTYNVITNNYKLSEIVDVLKEWDSNLSLNMVNTPLLNQFNYFVSDKKFRDTGFKPKQEIKVEIFKTLELLKNIS